MLQVLNYELRNYTNNRKNFTIQITILLLIQFILMLSFPMQFAEKPTSNYYWVLKNWGGKPIFIGFLLMGLLGLLLQIIILSFRPILSDGVTPYLIAIHGQIILIIYPFLIYLQNQFLGQFLYQIKFSIYFFIVWLIGILIVALFNSYLQSNSDLHYQLQPYFHHLIYNFLLFGIPIFYVLIYPSVEIIIYLATLVIVLFIYPSLTSNTYKTFKVNKITLFLYNCYSILSWILILETKANVNSQRSYFFNSPMFSNFLNAVIVLTTGTLVALKLSKYHINP